MGVSCIAHIVFSLACMVRGNDPMPQELMYGRAVVSAQTDVFFHTPIVGPLVAWKVNAKYVPADKGPTLVSYAPIPKKAEGFFKLNPNLFQLKDGNEQTACFKKNKKLARLMNIVREHYGKPLIVDSGYRSPKYNAGVSGAKNSAHMRCNAVDFQIAGVSKHALASYLRSIPGVGGVGLYCNSDPVHMDVERRRDWNWSCKGNTAALTKRKMK